MRARQLKTKFLRITAAGMAFAFALAGILPAPAFAGGRSRSGGGKAADIDWESVGIGVGTSIGGAFATQFLSSAWQAAAPATTDVANATSGLGKIGSGLSNTGKTIGTLLTSAKPWAAGLQSFSTFSNVLPTMLTGFNTYVAASQAGRAIGAAGNYYKWDKSGIFLASSLVNGAVGGFLDPANALGNKYVTSSLGNMAKGAGTGIAVEGAKAGVILAMDGDKINAGQEPSAGAQILGMMGGVAAGNLARTAMNPETWRFGAGGEDRKNYAVTRGNAPAGAAEQQPLPAATDQPFSRGTWDENGNLQLVSESSPVQPAVAPLDYGNYGAQGPRSYYADGAPVADVLNVAPQQSPRSYYADQIAGANPALSNQPTVEPIDYGNQGPRAYYADGISTPPEMPQADYYRQGPRAYYAEQVPAARSQAATPMPRAPASAPQLTDYVYTDNITGEVLSGQRAADQEYRMRNWESRPCGGNNVEFVNPHAKVPTSDKLYRIFVKAPLLDTFSAQSWPGLASQATYIFVKDQTKNDKFSALWSSLASAGSGAILSPLANTAGLGLDMYLGKQEDRLRARQLNDQYLRTKGMEHYMDKKAGGVLYAKMKEVEEARQHLSNIRTQANSADEELKVAAEYWKQELQRREKELADSGISKEPYILLSSENDLNKLGEVFAKMSGKDLTYEQREALRRESAVLQENIREKSLSLAEINRNLVFMQKRMRIEKAMTFCQPAVEKWKQIKDLHVQLGDSVVAAYADAQLRQPENLPQQRLSLNDALKVAGTSKTDLAFEQLKLSLPAAIFQGSLRGLTEVAINSLVNDKSSYAMQVGIPYALNLGSAIIRGAGWHFGWGQTTKEWQWSARNAERTRWDYVQPDDYDGYIADDGTRVDPTHGGKFDFQRYMDHQTNYREELARYNRFNDLLGFYPGYGKIERDWKEWDVNKLNSEGKPGDWVYRPRWVSSIIFLEKQEPTLPYAIGRSVEQANRDALVGTWSFFRPLTRESIGDAHLGLEPAQVSTLSFANYLGQLKSVSAMGFKEAVAFSSQEANKEALTKNAAGALLQIPHLPQLSHMQPERLVLTATVRDERLPVTRLTRETNAQMNESLTKGEFWQEDKTFTRAHKLSNKEVFEQKPLVNSLGESDRFVPSGAVREKELTIGMQNKTELWYLDGRQRYENIQAPDPEIKYIQRVTDVDGTTTERNLFLPARPEIPVSPDAILINNNAPQVETRINGVPVGEGVLAPPEFARQSLYDTQLPADNAYINYVASYNFNQKLREEEGTKQFFFLTDLKGMGSTVQQLRYGGGGLPHANFVFWVPFPNPLYDVKQQTGSIRFLKNNALNLPAVAASETKIPDQPPKFKRYNLDNWDGVLQFS
jgi:hypothetical protein